MKFRTKLIVGSLMVVIGTIILSTIGVSYLVRKQNDENGKSQILRAVKFAGRFLDDMRDVSIKSVSDFASKPTHVINFRYLMEIKANRNADAYKFIVEQPKEEMLLVLLAVVNERNLDGVWAYDGDGDLVLYINRKDKAIEIGLITTDNTGNNVAKYQELTEGGGVATNWQVKSEGSESDRKLQSPMLPRPESHFGVIDNKIALIGMVPVIASDLYLDSKEKRIGCVKFCKFLGQNVANFLSKEIETEVNIFTGAEPTAGTLKLSHGEAKRLAGRMRQDGKLTDPSRFIEVVSLGEKEYYQAGIPLFSRNDYCGALVLTLSRDDTLRRTRENIYLLFLVMGVSTLVVIPIAIFIASRFSMRVTGILSAVEKFTGGDLSARVGFSGEDEVGMLASAFNQMARDLQKTMEEVNLLNSQLEQRVADRTAQLEAANKELQSFSYSVSHDLRAPLRGINGWCQALIEDCSDQLDDHGRQCLERVRTETLRMGGLIDDLLALSQLTRTDMRIEKVDISALVSEIAAGLKASEPEREVCFEIQPGLTIEGDRRLLGIMLTNLVGNAWKFTVKNRSARIEFGRTENQGRQSFFVRDDGVGFDMAHASKLFVSFQRLHGFSEFPGSGIGLATVQRVIRRHGGSIWAEAQVGKGATFFFSL